MRWQLRTWTKGTGATVEPAGAPDRPRSRARPGGLPAMPPKRAWAPTTTRPKPRLPEPRIERRARQRHALGYLDAASLERLEQLEAELGRETPRAPGPDAERAGRSSTNAGGADP
jgi:hypothetical protein